VYFFWQRTGKETTYEVGLSRFVNVTVAMTGGPPHKIATKLWGKSSGETPRESVYTMRSLRIGSILICSSLSLHVCSAKVRPIPGAHRFWFCSITHFTPHHSSAVRSSQLPFFGCSHTRWWCRLYSKIQSHRRATAYTICSNWSSPRVGWTVTLRIWK
jgi:hypothetical protein